MNDWSETVDLIASRAEEANGRQEGDYIGEDGLLYCGQCRTPKQTVIKLIDSNGGTEKVVPCMCKCREEKVRQIDKELKANQRKMKIQQRRNECFGEGQMQKWTFENDDGKSRKVMDVARRFVDNFETFYKDGKGLLFFGSVGTGKSYAAAAIANALIDKGYACLMTNFSTLANRLTGQSFEKKQDFIDGLSRYDLMVIDDLATERDTDYMNEVVQTVIDARYRSRKPIIITTNLESEQLKNPSDLVKKRIYSRMYEMCHYVEVKGGDRRRKKLINDTKVYAELLGLEVTG